MKNPYLTALPIVIGIPLLLLCACGDDTQQQVADSDSVAQTPPKDPKPQVATSRYAGTYSFGTNAEKEATGTLMIFPVSDSMAIAHLDVQNGAPAHNMGTLTQSVHIHGDSALFWINTNDDGECKISMHFSGNDVTLKTYAAKGCEFGANVTADHVYTRTNMEVPDYYMSGEGDTTWFQEHMDGGLSMPAH